MGTALYVPTNMDYPTEAAPVARQKRDIVRQHFVIPRELMAEVELYLMDPVKGKLRYGALSTLVCALLQQFVREIQKPGINPGEILRQYHIDIGD